VVVGGGHPVDHSRERYQILAIRSQETVYCSPLYKSSVHFIIYFVSASQFCVFSACTVIFISCLASVTTVKDHFLRTDMHPEPTILDFRCWCWLWLCAQFEDWSTESWNARGLYAVDVSAAQLGQRAAW